MGAENTREDKWNKGMNKRCGQQILKVSDRQQTTDQETHRTPIRINAERHICGYSVFELWKIKDKEKILKKARKKKPLPRDRIQIRLNFSSKTMQTRRKWGEILLKC